MTIDFKPSQVHLAHPFALLDTFGNFDREHAAMLLVRTMQVLGDEWRAVGLLEVQDVVTGDMLQNVQPIVSYCERLGASGPDFEGLVRHGFTDVQADKQYFTERGLERLRKWVVPAKHDA